MKDFSSISPFNDKIVHSFDFHKDSKIKLKIKKSVLAQKKWKNYSLKKRIEILTKLKSILKDNKNKYAFTMAEEMGKPIGQGISEIEKCLLLLDYYKNNIAKLINQNISNTSLNKKIVFRPLGVILGIMPWNFPFWQVFRFIIPTLLSGNTVLLKHSLNVQKCALHIEEMFLELGLNADIYQNLRLSDTKTAKLIKHKSVSAVSFTGGSKAGSIVAKKAGAHLKKVLLELGGSDPLIVFPDANIKSAIKSCISGRLLNAGQSCISIKRIIVTIDLYDSFIKNIVSILRKKKMGNPLESVDLGPMVSKEARLKVHKQVKSSEKKGARILLGGKISKGIGAFYPVTVLSEVKPGMEVFDEEVFGPVFSIIKAKNEIEAIKLANNSSYGLGASIFSENIEKARKIAVEQLNVGMCYVNDFVKSDPELPFGGIKKSGFGRELSLNGFLEFVNVKTIVVNKI